MSTVSRWLVCLVVFVIGLACGLSLHRPVMAQTPGKPGGPPPGIAPAAVAKWEYRILVWNVVHEEQDKFEAKLDKLGEEGFEVVSQSIHPNAHALMIYTLKRIKKN